VQTCARARQRQYVRERQRLATRNPRTERCDVKRAGSCLPCLKGRCLAAWCRCRSGGAPLLATWRRQQSAAVRLKREMPGCPLRWRDVIPALRAVNDRLRGQRIYESPSLWPSQRHRASGVVTSMELQTNRDSELTW